MVVSVRMEIYKDYLVYYYPWTEPAGSLVTPLNKGIKVKLGDIDIGLTLAYYLFALIVL